LPADKADEILLSFALKVLRSVIAYGGHRSGYFAAITVWSGSTDVLTPNLFIWCGRIRQLRAKLALNEVATDFGKYVRRLARRAFRLDGQITVLEDTATAPELTRVFLAPGKCKGLVPLQSFC
jgi:hypothetical protein